MMLADIKRACYIAETVFGVFLYVLGIFTLKVPDPIDMVVGYLTCGVGSLLLLFGATTWLLRNEWDIWQ